MSITRQREHGSVGTRLVVGTVLSLLFLCVIAQAQPTTPPTSGTTTPAADEGGEGGYKNPKNYEGIVAILGPERTMYILCMIVLVAVVAGLGWFIWWNSRGTGNKAQIDLMNAAHAKQIAISKATFRVLSNRQGVLASVMRRWTRIAGTFATPEQLSHMQGDLDTINDLLNSPPPVPDELLDLDGVGDSPGK